MLLVNQSVVILCTYNTVEFVRYAKYAFQGNFNDHEDGQGKCSDLMRVSLNSSCCITQHIVHVQCHIDQWRRSLMMLNSTDWEGGCIATCFNYVRLHTNP